MRGVVVAQIIVALLALNGCSSGSSGKSKPTPTPSAVPSNAPTPVPTVKPTVGPTAAPTPTPPAAPTLSPSGVPVATPTPTAVRTALWDVSGAITVLAGNRIDSDTNDAGSPRFANDGPDTAQDIPNSGRLGGYVAVAGAGADGPLKASGDPLDVYRANLLQGQFVALHIADPDPSSGDLDLYLYDADLNPVAASENPGDVAVESLQVPTTAVYFIAVAAYQNAEFGIASASNYVLQVSDTAATQGVINTQSDFVPGEAVVMFHEPRMTKAMATAEGRARALGMQWLGGAPGRAMRFAEIPGTRKSALYLPFGKPPSADMQKQLQTFRMLKSIRARADVAFAEPNLRRYVRAVPNDAFYDRQWHYPLINLPQAWDITTGSADVLVAVIDSGVLINHPDLTANLDPNDPDGIDFISPLDIANDGDGADQNADDAGDAENPDGSGSFHGTHVAGTIAAVTNNSTGVAGVCWTCKIMPLRALGKGGGTGFDIDQAVRYAAGLSNDYGITPAKKADIINMSLGGGGFSQAEQLTFNQVRAAGVIVTASAGNGGTSQLEYPASYDNVVSVGAVGPDRQRAGYSQFNARVDVVGPGGNANLGRDAQVASTLGFGTGSPGDVEFGYAFYQGTSMSSPHVAGVAALMKAVNPALSPDQFDAALANGSIVDDAGAAGRDNEYGFGIINAFKAVQEAQRLASGQAPAENPQLAVSPAGVNFGTGLNSVVVNARNVGSGSLQITSVDKTAAPWLSVTEQGGGDYRLTADRSLLPVGVTDANVVFVSNVNSVSVPVRIEVVDASVAVADDAGHHYILLIPVADPENPVELDATVTAGQYAFTFADVPEGDYYLVAGTDMDNDFSICDDGEACGIYPVGGDLQPIRVNADLSGVQFPTGFEVSFQQLAAPATNLKHHAGFAIRH